MCPFRGGNGSEGAATAYLTSLSYTTLSATTASFAEDGFHLVNLMYQGTFSRPLVEASEAGSAIFAAPTMVCAERNGVVCTYVTWSLPTKDLAF